MFKWKMVFCLLSSFVLVIAKCHAQVPTYSVYGNAPIDNFGRQIAGVGDIDGDGCDDFAVGALGFNSSGQVTVHSGQNGAIIYTLDAANPGDRFGFSVAGLGDLDNDGTPDIIVGAAWETTGSGTGYVKVFSGIDGSVIYTLFGDNPGDSFGSAVASIGDVDGDLIDDFVVGAYGSSAGGTNHGMVRAFSGFDGSTLYSVSGSIVDSGFGWSVDGTGDVDGDGIPDFVVGAPGFDYPAVLTGSASVHSGLDGTLIHVLTGIDPNSKFGLSVGGAGDVDADGFLDIVVGAPQEDVGFSLFEGVARVYSGMTGLVLYEFFGYGPVALFGTDVDCAGDYNSDGYDDIVVGAPSAQDGPYLSLGSVRVYSGKDGSILKLFYGDNTSSAFGCAVHGGSDLNGDGLVDVLVSRLAALAVDAFTKREIGEFMLGYPPVGLVGHVVRNAQDINNDGLNDIMLSTTTTGSGVLRRAVRLVSGVDGATLMQISGNPGDQLGFATCALGDINGDGHSDILVGAPQLSSASLAPGYAKVFSGKDGTVLFSHAGTNPDDAMGASVSAAGDVNSDGVTDYVVGSPGDDTFGFNAGRANVYSGSDGSVLFSFHGDATIKFTGLAVSGAGDTNNDGFDDIMVSGSNSSQGCLRIFSGLDGSLLHSIVAGPGILLQGQNLSELGDVNDDGCDDFIVGEPEAATNGPGSGRVRIFSGIDASLIYSYNGDSPQDRLGTAVSNAGDVNGDGYSDMIMGAPNAHTMGEARGKVLIVSGIDGSIINSSFGATPLGSWGASVDEAGDLNQDGFADVIVGHPGGANHGLARIIYAETLPILRYSSGSGGEELDLDWFPDGGDIHALSGTLSCTGASPGGLGAVGVSLARDDTLVFGLPLLLAVDQTNLIYFGTFGFGIAGDFVLPNVSRQNPYIAGSLIHIQYFETSPVGRSSNGIRLLTSP